jgi:signal transduction histidine kinase
VTGHPRTQSLRTPALRIDRFATWPVRPWVTSPNVADVLVVLLLASLGVWEGWLGWGPHPVLTVAVLAVEVGTHAFRRAAPVLVLLAVAATMFSLSAFHLPQLGLAWGNTTGDLSLWLAVYTVAALRGPRWAVLAIIVEVATYAPLTRIPNTCDVFCLVGWSGLFVFAAIGGTAVYQGRRLNKALGAQTDLLRRTREERVRLAVSEERTRVARDLHDVVAHGLTVMVVQAGAARALVASNPSKAREALAAVDRAGRDARRELGSLMGSLGSIPLDGGERPNGEYPSIRSLVHQAVGTGMDIELSLEAEPDSADPGLEISLYRIVQEALTNVCKHAPGARVWIHVRYSSPAVEVEVTDSGSPTEPEEGGVPGAGQGLIGIRERAALFGGEVETGPMANGGFRMRARLLREPATPVVA